MAKGDGVCGLGVRTDAGRAYVRMRDADPAVTADEPNSNMDEDGGLLNTTDEMEQVEHIFTNTFGPLARNVADTRVEAVAEGWIRATEGFEEERGGRSAAAWNATDMTVLREELEEADEFVAQQLAALLC